MRILVVAHGFPPAAQGGAEIYAHAHARALRELFGDEIFVLTREAVPDAPEYRVRTEVRDGLRIAWINNTFRATRSFEESYRNEAITRIADRLIDDFRPDAAHIHHLTCLSTTIVRSLVDRAIPVLHTLHDYWLLCHRGQFLDRNYQVCDAVNCAPCRACLDSSARLPPMGASTARLARSIERTLPPALGVHLRGAAGRLFTGAASESAMSDSAAKRTEHMREVCGLVSEFLAPSSYLRDRFLHFGVPSSRITHHPYGFAHAPFSGLERCRSRPLRLGFLGTMMVSKAPHILLEAARRLPGGTVTIDLCGAFAPYHGDDSYRGSLDPLLQHEAVRLRGAIPHTDVPRVLASIDVLVVPSVWPENSPLVIHEAFLAGIPVVASRIGGIPELVVDGRNGLLFRPGDPNDLADALDRLLNEPGLYEKLRAGIPPVRTIENDVRATRQRYKEHLSRQGTAVRRAKRVAAVVLNYRSSDDTLLAVRSLLASRSALHDVIVVDNGPGDGAQEALRDVAARVVYVRTGTNRGFSGGMNIGIREAIRRGADRVLLLNSDVMVRPDCVERLGAALDARRDAGIAGPLVLGRSTPWTVASLGISYNTSTGRVRQWSGQAADAAVDAVSGCAMFVAREVFDRVGLLDEDYFYGFEDVDFCLRARSAGFATTLVGSAVAYHEGGRSIGPRAAARLYFAARNHLLLARRVDQRNGRRSTLLRTGTIVVLNAAHALRASSGGTLPGRLAAVARGTRDYMMGRFGAGSESSRLES